MKNGMSFLAVLGNLHSQFRDDQAQKRPEHWMAVKAWSREGSVDLLRIVQADDFAAANRTQCLPDREALPSSRTNWTDPSAISTLTPPE